MFQGYQFLKYLSEKVMAILRQILENILRDSSKAMPSSKELISTIPFVKSINIVQYFLSIISNIVLIAVLCSKELMFSTRQTEDVLQSWNTLIVNGYFDDVQRDMQINNYMNFLVNQIRARKQQSQKSYFLIGKTNSFAMFRETNNTLHFIR